MLAFLLASVLFVRWHVGPHEIADAPRPEVATSCEDVEHPIERLRARLRARPQEERARLERHLEEFERLPSAARLGLLARARVLRAQERTLEVTQTSEPERRASSDSEHGREQCRARLRDGFRERGRELRARLPGWLRHRLEQVPPEQRHALLERLNQRREQVSLRALGGMRERCGLSVEEVRRLERLPLADRLQVMRELCMRAHGEPGAGRAFRR